MPGKPRGPLGKGDVEQPQSTSADESTPLVYGKGKPSNIPEEEVSLTKHPGLWLKQLSDSYSWRLLAMVVCTNHLLKGFVAGGGDEGLVGKPVEFLFSSMGIAGPQLQMFKAAAIAPWALKPVIALLSDGMPLFGYKRMSYVVIFTIFSLIATFCIGLGVFSTVHATVACLFFIFLQISAVDLLVEAKQSEEIKVKSKLGPQFFTFTWVGINTGQLFGMLLVGALIHHTGPRFPYLVAAPFIGLVMWPTLMNFMGEKPLPMEERGLNFRLVKKHPVLCTMTFMIGCMVMFMIVGTFLLNEEQLFKMSMVFAGLILVGFSCFVRKEITGPITFYFMLGLLSFSVDGALFYFYTDTPAQYPEGPHLSVYFYTSALGFATFVGIMTGFISGAELFKNWSYRGILYLTVVLRCFTQLLLLPVTLRWTLGWGIPDWIWILCATILDTMVFAWRWIPKQVMGAHLTPKGVEATMLGLSAGTFNLAMILGSYCGGYVLHTHGVRPSGQIGETFMFENLWRVQVLAAVAPFLMLPLIPVLIPAKTQTEPLIEDAKDSATHNSMWEKFKRRLD